MMKRIFLLFCVVALAVGFTVTAGAESKLRDGMVFDIGGKGDQSFNDSAYRGLQWASKLGV